MYIIETDYPYEQRGGRFGKYDFSFLDKIEVMQSVKMDEHREVQALRSHINRKRERGELAEGFAIATRADKERGGIRVWRIA